MAFAESIMTENWSLLDSNSQSVDIRNSVNETILSSNFFSYDCEFQYKKDRIFYVIVKV